MSKFRISKYPTSSLKYLTTPGYILSKLKLTQDKLCLISVYYFFKKAEDHRVWLILPIIE